MKCIISRKFPTSYLSRQSIIVRQCNDNIGQTSFLPFGVLCQTTQQIAQTILHFYKNGVVVLVSVFVNKMR